MTVADVSAGDQDAISPFQESFEQKAVIDPAGTHKSDQTNIGRILHAGHTRQVGPGVGAPVADESQYLGFCGSHIKLNIQSSCQLKIEDWRLKI